MEEQIIEMMGTLQTTIENVAPHVWVALVRSAFVSSVLTVLFIAIVFVADTIAIRKWTTWWDFCEEKDAEPVIIISTAALGVLTIVATICMFSTSTWLGLFDAESQAVIDLIKSVTT